MLRIVCIDCGDLLSASPSVSSQPVQLNSCCPRCCDALNEDYRHALDLLGELPVPEKRRHLSS